MQMNEHMHGAQIRWDLSTADCSGVCMTGVHVLD